MPIPLKILAVKEDPTIKELVPRKQGFRDAAKCVSMDPQLSRRLVGIIAPCQGYIWSYRCHNINACEFYGLFIGRLLRRGATIKVFQYYSRTGQTPKPYARLRLSSGIT